jgi:hypothetical protein
MRAICACASWSWDIAHNANRDEAPFQRLMRATRMPSAWVRVESLVRNEGEWSSRPF